MLSLIKDNITSNNRIENLEYRVRTNDNEWKWHSSDISINKDNKGNILNITGIARDITKLKTDNETLFNKAKELERFFSVNLDLLCITDLEGKFVRVNKSWEEILGFKSSELIGRKFIEFVHPDDIDKTNELNSSIVITNEINRFVNRYISVDGSYKYLEWKCRYYEGLVYSSARDITFHKSIEEALSHSKDLMNYIIEHSRSSVAVHDREMNYLYVSQSYLDNYNIKNKDIIGKNHYDVFPDLPDKWKSVHKRALNGEVLSNDEDIYERADGSTEWTQWECRPWYEQNGEIGGIIVYTEVITERKKMEELIYNEREQFKATLLSVGDGVICSDINGNVTLMNSVAENLTGWKLSEAENRYIAKILNIADESTGKSCEDSLANIIKNQKAGNLGKNLVLISKTGAKIPIEDSISPIKGKDGKVIGIVIVFRDFSEKKDRQNQIEYLSYHDYLTGLYNRRYMEEKIKKIDKSHNLPLTFLVLDVNGLKLTNDAFGHTKGDELLSIVAEIMRKTTSESDILCRLGGDEFAIIMPDTDESRAEKIKSQIIYEASITEFESIIVSVAIGYSTKYVIDKNIQEIFIEADNEMYKDKLRYGKTMRSKTIEILLRNIYEKYKKEKTHTERVSKYCEEIVKAMNAGYNETQAARMAGSLHDIGKIMVPASILNKEDGLTPTEWDEVRRHPVTSYQILKSVDEYAALAEAVLYHHERFDGKGYPEGITGDDIPILSKIIAVADAYEAMTAQRDYKPSKTSIEAANELIRFSGTQFDPDIVKIFIEKVLRLN